MLENKSNGNKGHIFTFEMDLNKSSDDLFHLNDNLHNIRTNDGENHLKIRNGG